MGEVGKVRLRNLAGTSGTGGEELVERLTLSTLPLST